MKEKVLIKGTYSPSSAWLSLVMFIIGVILVPIGFDGGRFGNHGPEYYMMFWGGLALIVSGITLLFYIGKCEIVVTDTRVYGKAAFGKRVDLPVDSISAIASQALFSGVAIATSSGRIAFLGLKNANDIHRVISDLLIQRQHNGRASAVTHIKQEIAQSNADELRKYKELLELGVISQEEFDAKKKQLLGL